MLQDLITTMQKSKQDTAKMSMWVHSNEDLLEIPTEDYKCGYAACVIGDHIIRTKNIKLPITFETTHFINNNADLYVSILERRCKDVFNNDDLSKSIYYACEDSRIDFAELSGLFTNEEMRTFDHLSLIYPKPEDVVIYLKACIEKIEQFTN